MALHIQFLEEEEWREDRGEDGEEEEGGGAAVEIVLWSLIYDHHVAIIQ